MSFRIRLLSATAIALLPVVAHGGAIIRPARGPRDHRLNRKQEIPP